MKKATPKLVITFICLIVLLVGYYAYLANKDREEKEEAKMTAVQEVLSRDLQYDYPPTVKEVIKYYNEIVKCFYNEDCTEGEINELGQKARELYDEELLEANEVGPYLIRLQGEVKEHKEKERHISVVVLGSSTSVDYFEEDGYSFARIMCGYNVTEGDENHATKQIYLLRKDENNRWKIYGWEDATNLQLQSGTPTE